LLDVRSQIPKEAQDREHPLETTSCFLRGMQSDPNAFEKATIPVEKLQAPLLLISGGDDKMWPSSFFAEVILKRLTQYRSPITRIHLHYPNAGHDIGVPFQPFLDTLYFHPIAKRWFDLGGTSYENELASRDSWSKMLQFFKTHLERPILLTVQTPEGFGFGASILKPPAQTYVKLHMFDAGDFKGP